MNVDGKLLLCSLGIYFSITSRAAGFLFYFFRVVVGVIGAKRKRNLIRQQTWAECVIVHDDYDADD